jgi:hypothetical protein
MQDTNFPRFLLALWRVFIVFPLARWWKGPCVIPDCKRERAEMWGKISGFCEFHHPARDPEYLEALREALQ